MATGINVPDVPYFSYRISIFSILGGMPLKRKREGAMMSNENEITGIVVYRGKKQIYTADFDADTSNDLVHLFPKNFTAAVPAIKKMPNMSYKETALYQLKKLVDHEVEEKA